MRFTRNREDAMTRKLSLELDTLSVDSFPTEAAGEGRPGTVRANEDEAAARNAAACTCAYSCICPSAYYWCGDGYQTLYSCDYSKNASCLM